MKGCVQLMLESRQGGAKKERRKGGNQVKVFSCTMGKVTFRCKAAQNNRKGGDHVQVFLSFGPGWVQQ